jgi:hypothetical protein
MVSSVLRSTVVGLGCLCLTGAASAGQIATPMLFLGGGNQLVCIANNVSAQAITVTVRIIGVSGDTTDTCALAAGDRDGCQVTRTDAGWCRITAGNIETEVLRSRVRGVLFNRRTTSPFTIETAVQAE